MPINKKIKKRFIMNTVTNTCGEGEKLKLRQFVFNNLLLQSPWLLRTVKQRNQT